MPRFPKVEDQIWLDLGRNPDQMAREWTIGADFRFFRYRILVASPILGVSEVQHGFVWRFSQKEPKNRQEFA